jgi:hypothetical protein
MYPFSIAEKSDQSKPSIRPVSRHVSDDIGEFGRIVVVVRDNELPRGRAPRYRRLRSRIVEKGKLASINLSVLSPLIFYVVLDYGRTRVLADGISWGRQGDTGAG